MAYFHLKLLLLLFSWISSSSGYHYVAVTATPQYITRGENVQFECVFRTDEAIPTYTRMVLRSGGSIVKEIPNSRITWESSGDIHYTDLSYSKEIYEDEDFMCIAHFGDPVRQYANASYAAMVCCPLRIESKRHVIDTSRDIYGLDITVSGNDIGEGTIIQTPTSSPVELTVTSSVISGRFQLGQTQAKRFSIRWKTRPESCEDEGGVSHDFTFRVRGQEQSEVYKDVPFKTLYAAMWKKIATQVYTVSQGDRYNRTLRCDICANPPPTITWYLCGDNPPSDVIISQSGAELTIPEVQDRHVGVYVCEATNIINNQRQTKKFDLKLSINGSQTEPNCLRDARIKTFVIPTVIVIVIAVIVVIICWKCRQIQDFCQGLKEHVTSDQPEDRWIPKIAHPTVLPDTQPPDTQPPDNQPPDVLPGTPPDKPPRECSKAAEGVQYAVLDELKPGPERTPTLPRGGQDKDDDERVEYATIVSGN